MTKHWRVCPSIEIDTMYIFNVPIDVLLKGFTCPFSSKSTDEVGESPRLREFRKKLRERAPIGTLRSSSFSWISTQRFKAVKKIELWTWQRNWMNWKRASILIKSKNLWNHSRTTPIQKQAKSEVPVDQSRLVMAIGKEKVVCRTSESALFKNSAIHLLIIIRNCY